MEVGEAEFISDQVAYVANAIRAIAHGDVHDIGGLEGLAVAIAGRGLQTPLAEAIDGIASAILVHSASIDRLADALGGK